MHVIMNKGREFTTFSVSNFLVFIVCLCFGYETDTDILMVNLSAYIGR